MILLLAVMAMVLLSTTTMAMLAVSVTEPIIANNLLLGSQAFYLAESGLEIALGILNANVPLVAVTGSLAGGTYAITFSVEGVDRVHVRSVGRIASAVRMVSNRFERDAEGVWRPLKQFREEAP